MLSKSRTWPGRDGESGPLVDPLPPCVSHRGRQQETCDHSGCNAELHLNQLDVGGGCHGQPCPHDEFQVTSHIVASNGPELLLPQTPRTRYELRSSARSGLLHMIGRDGQQRETMQRWSMQGRPDISADCSSVTGVSLKALH